MVLFPLKDYNPREHIRFQVVTFLIIAANVAAYLWEQTWPDLESGFFIYGLVPSLLWEFWNLQPMGVEVTPVMTIFTSMFLHGGFLHILGNMLYLWVFGDNVEDSMGHGRFLVFYLLCGVAAALTQAAVTPHSNIPMVGASGAISGILGAYFVLHPRTHVLVAIFARFTARLPTYAVLGLWILTQSVSAAVDDGTDSTAWWAHIGGFVAGMILILPFRRRGVLLFDRIPEPVFAEEAPPSAKPVTVTSPIPPTQRKPRHSLLTKRGRSRIPHGGSRNRP